MITFALWGGFLFIILFSLLLDFGVFQRKNHVVSLKEALIHTGYWVFISLAFNALIYFYLGSEAALQFFTGYLVEKSLSVDNLFVFLLIFTAFKVPAIYQHKILFWGILGAIFFRFTLIVIGIELITQFHWILYLLGAFLLFTGIKLVTKPEHKIRKEKSFLVAGFKKIFPVAHGDGKGKFFITERGQRKMTILFLVLLTIESTDIIFALDSIPAIFAITTDPFIVYTSNVFAVLGLRELYFLLHRSMEKLRFFRYGLALILCFVGAKLALADIYPISLIVSLSVILSILFGTALLSLTWGKRWSVR